MPRRGKFAPLKLSDKASHVHAGGHIQFRRRRDESQTLAGSTSHTLLLRLEILVTVLQAHKTCCEIEATANASVVVSVKVLRRVYRELIGLESGQV